MWPTYISELFEAEEASSASDRARADTTVLRPAREVLSIT